MRVEITTRHCDLSPELKDRVTSRMEKLLRFDDGIKDARVVVSLEKNRFNAEATVQANGGQLVSHAEDDTDRVALEQVLDRLEAQVKKQRDRIVKRRKRGGGRPEPAGEAEAAAEADEEAAEVFGEESDYEGLISEEAGEAGSVMMLAEAVAQLRASRRESLTFTNKTTGRAVLLFKRRDGNVGMVELPG